MTRTCAICGFRDASKLVGWEGRPIHACTACVQPPPEVDHGPDVDEMSLAARAVYMARRHPGKTVAEICELLGHEGWGEPRSETRRIYDAITNGLARAARSGVLTYEGNAHGGRIYFPTNVQWTPGKQQKPKGPRRAKAEATGRREAA